jgi:hypothetical protein
MRIGMDLTERFPSVDCDSCKKVQPLIFGVLKADAYIDFRKHFLRRLQISDRDFAFRQAEIE